MLIAAAASAVTTCTVFLQGVIAHVLSAESVALAGLVAPLAIFKPVKEFVESLLSLFILNRVLLSPFRVNPLLLLPVSVDPFPSLSISFDPCLFLSVAVNVFPFLLFPVNFCPVTTAPMEIPGPIFKRITGIVPEILGAVGVLAVFFCGKLVTVDDASSVTGGVLPATRPCYPPVVPDKSWSFMHININIVVGPIEIAPGAKGGTKIKAGPV